MNTFDRQPPYDLDAERATLGSILLNNQALDEVIGVLGPNPETFYTPANQTVYTAMLHLRAKNEPIDVVTLQKAVTGITGGFLAIAMDITNAVPTSANAEHYARQVLDAANMRELITASALMQAQAYTTDDAQGVLDDAQASVFRIAQTRRSASMVSLSDILPAVQEGFDAIVRSKDGMTGVASGIKPLDEITTGWKDGELIVVAARPSVGKTAFLLNSLHFAASNGIPVLLFSLEMDAAKLGQRLVCLAGEVDVAKLRDGFNIRSEEERIKGTIANMRDVPIYIDDSPRLTLWQVRSEAMRFVTRHKQSVGKCLIMVDYLQLLHTGSKQANKNRYEEVGELSNGLKHLARELNAPVLVACQLGRAAESEHDGYGMLKHLRESGNIEQDLDTCVVLARPNKDECAEFLKIGQEPGNVIITTVAKQRNGVQGHTSLTFDKPIQRMTAYGSTHIPSPWRGKDTRREEAQKVVDTFDTANYEEDEALF